MASVVVIENEAPLVRLLGWFLVDAGHEVIAIENVAAATARVREVPPDVIVFNSGLPASAKRPFIDEWRLLHPPLKVVDVSRKTTIIERPAYTGADAYLQMPFDAARFIDTVDRLLERQR